MARNALTHLFQQRHFSICTIDALCEIAGTSRHTPAYALLRPLHCMDYSAMDPELREQLPHLVREALQPPPRCVAADVALHGVTFQ